MKQLKTTYKVALAFFTFGTLLFILQVIVRGITGITMVGYFYVIVSIIINLIILIVLVFSLAIKNENIPETLKSIGVILANIPIAYLYFYIVMNFLID